MSFAPKQFIRSVDFLSTENAINTSTGCVNIYGGMSVSKDSYLTNMIVVGNSTVTNLNITGALITSTGNTLTSSQWTSIDSNSDIYFGTSANAFVGIGTTTPTFNLDISGGSRITGGLTVGNLNVNTGATITNILNTTICTGTTIVSGGITTSTIRVTGNADLSTGLTTVTDLTGTNITSATIRASTLISTANLGANNVTSGTIQASTLISTANLATNNFSSGTIRATTLITSANITANNFTANNLISSNITSSNLRVSGTINSGDITVGNINFTGSLYQNGSAYLGSQWTTTSGNTLTYTSGNVSINNTFTTSRLNVSSTASSSNSSTGSVVLQGGLSINNLTNATSVSDGGALTVAGGAAVSGDLIVGGSILYSNAAAASSTFAYLTLTASDWSTDVANGGLVVYGGISIQNTANATSASSGNGLTIAGGAGIGADLYVGGVSYLPNVVSTNNTTTNIRTTNLSSGIIQTSTGITTATIRVTGNSDLSTGLTTVTDLTGTNITSGTIRASTLISTANLGANNITAGTIQASTLISTANLATNNFSSGTIRASTLITSANIASSNLTTNNLLGTAISTSTLNATTIATALLTASTSVSTTSLLATSASIGNISAASINLSSNLNVAGTLTVVNVTTTNLTMSNGNALLNLVTSGSIINTGTITSGPLMLRTPNNYDGRILTLSTLTAGNSYNLTFDAVSNTANNVYWTINQNTLSSTYSNMLTFYGGNVGINTTQASSKFVIADSGATKGHLKLVSNNGATEDNWWLGFCHVDSSDSNDRARIGVKIQSGGAGRLFFTTGGFGAQAERMTIDASGNIGIGTTSPGNNLDVSGTARITTSLTTGSLFSTNQTTTNIVGTNTTFGGLTSTGLVYLLSTAGNIASTSNNYSITSGSVNITGDVVISGNQLFYTTTGVGAPAMNGRGDGSKIVLYPETNTTKGDYSIGIESAYMWFQVPNINYAGYKFYQGTTTSLIITPAGNVGIGTTSPITSLHAQNGLYASSSTGTALTGFGSNATQSSSATVCLSDNIIPLQSALRSPAMSTSLLNDPQVVLQLVRGGTSTQSWDGIANFAICRYQNSSNFAKTRLDIQLSGEQSSNSVSTIMSMQSNGFVGVGTTSPSNTLHVLNNSSTAMTIQGFNPQLNIVNPTSGNESSISFSTLSGALHYIGNNVGGCGVNNFGFYINGSTRMTLTSNGNVGIGTSSPSRMLSLSGASASIVSGPHTWINTSDQTNPVFQQLNWSADNISMNFDMYYDGAFRNSGSSTAFQIYKAGSQLKFTYQNGSAGTANGQTTCFVVGSTGNIGILNGTPIYTLDVSGTTRISNTTATSMGTLIVAGPGSGIPATATSGQLASFYGPGGGGVISHIDLSTYLPSTNQNFLPSVRFSMLDLAAGNSNFNILTRNSGATGTMASRIFIDGSGNIGINTTSPTARLHVTDNISGENNIRIQNSNTGSSATAALRLTNNSGNDTLMFLNGSARTADGGANTCTIRNDAGALRLQGSGSTNTIYLPSSSTNVGINTTSPRSNLEITQTSTTTGLMLFSGNDTGVNRIIFNHSDTSSNYQKVSIETQASGTNQFGRGNFSIRVNTAGDATNTAAGDTRFFIHGTSGNVGIMTTVPTDFLQVSNVMVMASNGNLTCTGDVFAFGTISDERLKTNITSINSENALDTVKQLNPVTFTWKDTIFNQQKRNKNDVGFIAQEVEKLIPYAVGDYREIETGEFYKNMKHERIIPYLTAAIQTLTSRLEESERQITILQDKLCNMSS